MPSINDTIQYQLTSDDGSSQITGSQQETGTTHVNVVSPFAAGTSQPVTGVAFAYATLKALVIKASANCTLVFTCTSGTVTINLLANVPYVWQLSPGYFANPFTHDVTSLAITNTASLTLYLRALN